MLAPVSGTFRTTKKNSSTQFPLLVLAQCHALDAEHPAQTSEPGGCWVLLTQNESGTIFWYLLPIIEKKEGFLFHVGEGPEGQHVLNGPHLSTLTGERVKCTCRRSNQEKSVG
jgi:hypothetical protein